MGMGEGLGLDKVRGIVHLLDVGEKRCLSKCNDCTTALNHCRWRRSSGPKCRSRSREET